MSLNWAEIDLVLEELDLAGCFVQEIIQPDFRNLYLGLFRESERFYLRICLETGKTRLHRALRKPRKPPTRQRFAQLLHSRIRGGRITDARQLNRDRIVAMEIVRSGEVLRLWIRLWGGAANIILTGADNTIVDAFFRRPNRDEITDAPFSVEPRTLEPAEIARTERFTPRFTSHVNNSLAESYRAAEQAELRNRMITAARKALERDVAGLRRRMTELTRKLETIEEPSQLRHYGDLLYTYLHLIEPGSRWAEVPDYDHDDAPTSIAMQPEMSPQENAESFYERARKAERRFTALSEESRNLTSRRDEATQLLDSLDELDIPDLQDIVDRSHPRERRSAHGAASERPGLTFSSHGFTILVGRNSRENDALLRHHVRGNDTWLHVRDFPGGYVFVRAQKGKTVPLPVLLSAGMLAIHYSKAKTNGRADLYYTQVKYLRRARNGPPGLVLPTQEKNLRVEVDDQQLAELLGGNRLT